MLSQMRAPSPLLPTIFPIYVYFFFQMSLLFRFSDQTIYENKTENISQVSNVIIFNFRQNYYY